VINAVDGRDVATAHLAAAERGRAGERYILGGHNVTLRALLEVVDRCQGVRRRRLRLPRALLSALVRLSDALPFATLPDHLRMFAFWCPVNAQKAERELGHVARPIEETIRDMLAWFELLKQR